MIKLEPKDIGWAAVVGILLSIITLLIFALSSSRGGNCSVPGAGYLLNCSVTSLDLSPSRGVLSPKYFAYPEINDEYHPVSEPNTAYLLGLGGGLILFSKAKRDIG